MDDEGRIVVPPTFGSFDSTSYQDEEKAILSAAYERNQVMDIFLDNFKTMSKDPFIIKYPQSKESCYKTHDEIVTICEDYGKELKTFLASNFNLNTVNSSMKSKLEYLNGLKIRSKKGEKSFKEYMERNEDFDMDSDDFSLKDYKDDINQFLDNNTLVPPIEVNIALAICAIKFKNVDGKLSNFLIISAGLLRCCTNWVPIILRIQDLCENYNHDLKVKKFNYSCESPHAPTIYFNKFETIWLEIPYCREIDEIQISPWAFKHPTFGSTPSSSNSNNNSNNNIIDGNDNQGDGSQMVEIWNCPSNINPDKLKPNERFCSVEMLKKMTFKFSTPEYLPKLCDLVKNIFEKGKMLSMGHVKTDDIWKYCVQRSSVYQVIPYLIRIFSHKEFSGIKRTKSILNCNGESCCDKDIIGNYSKGKMKVSVNPVLKCEKCLKPWHRVDANHLILKNGGGNGSSVNYQVKSNPCVTQKDTKFLDSTNICDHSKDCHILQCPKITFGKIGNETMPVNVNRLAMSRIEYEKNGKTEHFLFDATLDTKKNFSHNDDNDLIIVPSKEKIFELLKSLNFNEQAIITSLYETTNCVIKNIGDSSFKTTLFKKSTDDIEDASERMREVQKNRLITQARKPFRLVSGFNVVMGALKFRSLKDRLSQNDPNNVFVYAPVKLFLSPLKSHKRVDFFQNVNGDNLENVSKVQSEIFEDIDFDDDSDDDDGYVNSSSSKKKKNNESSTTTTTSKITLEEDDYIDNDDDEKKRQRNDEEKTSPQKRMKYGNIDLDDGLLDSDSDSDEK